MTNKDSARRIQFITKESSIQGEGSHQLRDDFEESWENMERLVMMTQLPGTESDLYIKNI